MSHVLVLLHVFIDQVPFTVTVTMPVRRQNQVRDSESANAADKLENIRTENVDTDGEKKASIFVSLFWVDMSTQQW